MRPVLFAFALSLPALSADLEFKERFADPATRSEALSRLVPGTRDWFFYRALDHQLAGRDKEFSIALGEWKAASEDKERPVSVEGYGILENRSFLLAFRTNPEGSATDLIRQLDLHFDDSRPDAKADEKLPATLAADEISPAAFDRETARAHPENPWKGYTQPRLYAEMDRADSFSKAERTWVLDHLTRADHPATVALIAASLAAPQDRPEANLPASIPLLNHLTVAQMEELLRREPRLKGHQAFILRYLAALRPADDNAFRTDLSLRAAYAKRCVETTATLPRPLAFLYLGALASHLTLQQEFGNYPLEDFLAYLALPRQGHPLIRTAKSNALSDDGKFAETTGLPRVTDDEPLIRAYLDHFLATADSTAPFAPSIEEKRLAVLRAEARLLAGAEPAKWAPALEPAAFHDLQERTTIGFAPGQPVILGADAAVKLVLDLKNTPDLLVRVYPLDLAAWFSTHTSEPGANIDLDGLVPERETRLTYSQPPLVRHRETLDLPDLKGRGAWIVETVSRGVAARALVRKGQLVPLVDPAENGVTVRIFDETGTPVPDAALTVDGKTLKPGPDDRIAVSAGFRPNAPRTLATGAGLATRLDLDLEPSSPKLDAKFHVDREQLLANQRATLRLALNLTANGIAVPLDRLQNLTLTLTTTLAGDITTQRVISDGLKPVAEQTLDFLVPPDSRSIKLSLTALVPVASGGEPVELREDHNYRINGSLDSETVGTALLSLTTRGHHADLRGRNGEPLISRALDFRFTREGYADPVLVRMRTDANGRVELGTLDGITRILLTGNDIQETQFHPAETRGEITLPTSLFLTPRDTFLLPLLQPAASVERARFHLAAKGNSGELADFTDHLAIQNGRLAVKELLAGAYELTLDRQTVAIRVSSGAERDGLIFSPGKVDGKFLPALPALVSTTNTGGTLALQLAGTSPTTRVTVIGTRFLHTGAWLDLAAFEPRQPDYVDYPIATCGYLTERHLDDEMRYIFDRRNATAFPGTLLPRPGLLVNRWTADESAPNSPKVAGGAEGRGDGFGLAPRSSLGLSGGGGSSTQDSGTTAIDFLATGSVVRYALKPDDKGVVSIPLADFRTSQSLTVVVTDQSFMSRRVLPLEPSDPPLRDLRLLRPLDPAKHHTGTRGATFLTTGAETTIDNMLDADWRAFTTLDEAWSYLAGAVPPERKGLQDFAFLKQWPDLPETRKLELLSQHACHELHLFLARKDRPFFDKHIKPQLLEKTEPKFIDDYLLDRDLTGYLRPFAWNKLNAPEKALLSRALPAARERVATELRQRWDLEAPDAETDNTLFLATLRGGGMDRNATCDMTDSSSLEAGASYITSKLRTTIIPSINFEDTTVEEAIEYLRQRSVELDPSELDPTRKGVNFVVRRPNKAQGVPTTAGDGELGVAAEMGAMRIKQLRLRNVPLAVALKYICDATRLRYKVDEYAITLVPQTETGEDLFTRTFRVPKNFAAKLKENPAAEVPDPFASGRDNARAPNPHPAILDLLKQAGITFQEGSSATLAGNTLLMTNSPTELDKLEQLIDAVKQAGEEDSPRSYRNRRPKGTSAADLFSGGGVLPVAPSVSDSPGSLAVDSLAADAAGAGFEESRALSAPADAGKPASLTALDPDTTRIWRESNYHEHRGDTGEKFIPLNRFWIDLAAWDGQGQFLSPHFNACIHNTSEALLCLAFLDLPFKAEKPEIRIDGTKLRVKARAPMLLFFKDTRETAKIAPDAPVLVRETLHRLDEPTRTVNGRKEEASLDGNLVAGEHYGISLVITNPGGNERRVDVLAQIPAGAIPLNGLPVTLSKTVTLDPYGVENLDLAFYFPAPGSFTLYPLHATEADTVLAHAAARKIQVDAEPAALDATSWPVLARDGSNDAVLDRLRHDNLHTLDLDEILWRLHDRPFFLAVTALLRDRLVIAPKVSSYGFLHRDAASIREYFENSRAISQLGSWLDSPLLDIRPTVHLGSEFLEFDPLVNPRAHLLGDNPRLANVDARAFQEALLDQLAWKPALDDTDQLHLTLLLQLQDRTAEAIERFAKINPAKLPGRLAYDYLHAVLLFSQEKPEEARAIATGYKEHPLSLWRDRFAAVASQADEIASLAKERPKAPADPKATAPSLEIAAAPDGSLQLRHHSLERVKLQLFHVDLEVLFSKDPFLSGGVASLPPIRANDTREVALAGAETRVELPETFRHGNVLVAADTGTKRVLQVLDSRAIEILREPAQRTVQVLDAGGKPLVKSYVKVYVEKRDGSTAFLKDGYTDLRGKFDYLTHSSDPELQIQRIAVLIVHPTAGAKTMVFEP